MWIFHEFLQTLRKRQQFSTSSVFEGRNLSASLGLIFYRRWLGHGRNPEAVQEHLCKCFDNISFVTFTEVLGFGVFVVGSTAFTYGRVGCGMWICPGKEEGYPGLQWYDQREGAYWSVGAAFDASVPFTPRSNNMKTEKSLKIAKENEQPNFIFWGFHGFSALQYK